MTSNSNQCRICLEYGAVHSIFDMVDERHSLKAKLTSCLKEQIEDIEGFPRLMCGRCLDTLDIAYDFVQKYQETYEILMKNLHYIKTEKHEIYENILLETKVEFEPPDEDYCDNDGHSHCSSEGLSTVTDDKTLIIILEDTIKNKNKDIQEKLQRLPNITVKHKITDGVNVTPSPAKKIKVQLAKENKTDNTHASKTGKTRQQRAKSTIDMKSKKVGNNEVKNTIDKNIKQVGNNESDSQNSQDIESNIVNKIEMKKSTSKEQCELCGRSITTTKLQDHKCYINKDYSCYICKKQYLTKSAVKTHKEREHSNLANYICDHCGLSFFYSKSIKGHLYKAHPQNAPQRKLYKCSICSKTYTSSSALKQHKRVHTGECPFVCQYCGRAFSAQLYLKDHLRQHTGEKPFKCPICGKAHAQNGNMKSHMRHNHRRKDLDPETLKKLHPRFLKYLKPD